MTNINEMLLKLEVFWYATSFDLNMGYYHIWLIESTSKLCTILLRVKYSYKRLPMGVANLSEISNKKWMIYSKDLNSSVHI